MQSAFRPPVPSHGLLRYLRIQARAAPLFAPNRDAPASPSSCRRGITVRPSGRRPLSTACQRRHGAASSPVSEPHPVASRLRTRSSPRNNAIITPVNGSAAASFSTLGSVRRRRDANTDKNKKCDDRPPSWQERLWGYSSWMGAKAPPDLPVSDDLADSSSMFSVRRNLSAKAAMEQRLRCTEVDENGQVILVDGEFKKTELIAKYGLLPRDLRKIDSSNLPHILVRPSAILLNLLHLKVLIKRDRVLLFDVYGSQTSYPQSAFMYDLQGKLQQKSPQQQGGANANAAASGSTASAGGLLPYEFRALEAVLTSVTSELEADFEAVRDPVIRILSELEDDIDRHKLRILLILSKRVSTFEQKAKLVRDAIEELLEADDDLSAMYLTEKAHDLYRGLDDHTEVELLLESYHKLCDEVVQEAQNLVSSIRNTEEIVRAILDANRNALMLLELKFSVGTLGLAMGTFLAGLYGMNLENFIEETNWGFGAVTGVSVFFSLVVCWYGLVKLRKIQRVRMMGDEKGSLARNRHWFQDDGPLGLLEARNRERLRRMHQMKNVNKKK